MNNIWSLYHNLQDIEVGGVVNIATAEGYRLTKVIH
jgi:hypothetical protein